MTLLWKIPKVSGLNGDDVWVVVQDWHLNKIIWLINCFCSWKKSSQDKVLCGNILMIPYLVICN